MARDAWRDDVDSDPGSLPVGSSRWWPVVVGVLIAAMAIFIAGLYIPTRRAHEQLSGEYKALATSSQQLTQRLAKAESELDAAKKGKGQLETEKQQHEAAARAEAERLDRVRAEVASKLEKQPRKGFAVVVPPAGFANAPGGAALVVGLEEKGLFTPHRPDLVPQAAAILCDVARTATAAGPARVRAIYTTATPDGSTVPAEPGYANPFAWTAARAASVAQVLSERCGMGRNGTIAVGAGRTGPYQEALASAKLGPHIELEVVFSPAR